MIVKTKKASSEDGSMKLASIVPRQRIETAIVMILENESIYTYICGDCYDYNLAFIGIRIVVVTTIIGSAIDIADS